MKQQPFELYLLTHRKYCKFHKNKWNYEMFFREMGNFFNRLFKF